MRVIMNCSRANRRLLLLDLLFVTLSSWLYLNLFSRSDDCYLSFSRPMVDNSSRVLLLPNSVPAAAAAAATATHENHDIETYPFFESCLERRNNILAFHTLNVETLSPPL